MKLIVVKREVWIQPVAIEAESIEDGILKVREGKGKILEDEFEYSHSLDPDTWAVYNDQR